MSADLSKASPLSPLSPRSQPPLSGRRLAHQPERSSSPPASPTEASPASPVLLREERRALEKAALHCCWARGEAMAEGESTGDGARPRDDSREQAEACGFLEELRRLLRLHVFQHSVAKSPSLATDKARLVPRGPRTPAGIRAALCHVAKLLQLRALQRAQTDARTALRLLLVVHRLSLQLPTEILNAPDSPLERLPLLLLQRLHAPRESAPRDGLKGPAQRSLRGNDGGDSVEAGNLRLVAAYAGWLEQKLLVLRDLDLFFSGNWSLESFLRANRLESLPALAAAARDEDAESDVHISPVSVDILERLLQSVLLPALTLCRAFVGQAETPLFPLCAALLYHLADDVWGLFAVCMHFFSLLLARAEERRRRRRAAAPASQPRPAPCGRGQSEQNPATGDKQAEPRRLAAHAGETPREAAANAQLGRRLSSLRPGLIEAVRRLKEAADWCVALSSNIRLLARLRQPPPCLLSLLGDLLHVPPSSFSFSSCLPLGISPIGPNSFLVLRNDHARLLAHLPLPAPSLEDLAAGAPSRGLPSPSSRAAFACSACSSVSCFASWTAFLGGDRAFAFYVLWSVPSPGEARAGTAPTPAMTPGPCEPGAQGGVASSRASPSHMGVSEACAGAREDVARCDSSTGRAADGNRRTRGESGARTVGTRERSRSLSSRSRASSACGRERAGNGSPLSEPRREAGCPSPWVSRDDEAANDAQVNLYRLPPPEDDEPWRMQRSSSSRSRRASGVLAARSPRAGASLASHRRKENRRRDGARGLSSMQQLSGCAQAALPGNRHKNEEHAVACVETSGFETTAAVFPAGFTAEDVFAENPFSPRPSGPLFPPGDEPLFPSSSGQTFPYSSPFADAVQSRFSEEGREGREMKRGGESASPRPARATGRREAAAPARRSGETRGKVGSNFPDDETLHARARCRDIRETCTFSATEKRSCSAGGSSDEPEGPPSAAVASFEEVLLSFTKKGGRRDSSCDATPRALGCSDCSPPPSRRPLRRDSADVARNQTRQGEGKPRSHARPRRGGSCRASRSGSRGAPQQETAEASDSRWLGAGELGPGPDEATTAARAQVNGAPSRHVAFARGGSPPVFPELSPGDDRGTRPRGDLPGCWEGVWRQAGGRTPPSLPHTYSVDIWEDPDVRLSRTPPRETAARDSPRRNSQGEDSPPQAPPHADPRFPSPFLSPQAASPFASARGDSEGTHDRRATARDWPCGSDEGGSGPVAPSGYSPSSPPPTAAGVSRLQSPSPCFTLRQPGQTRAQAFPLGPFQSPAAVPCPRPCPVPSQPYGAGLSAGYPHASGREGSEDCLYFPPPRGPGPECHQPSDLAGFGNPAWIPFVPSGAGAPCGALFFPPTPARSPLQPPWSPALPFADPSGFGASPACLPPFGFAGGSSEPALAHVEEPGHPSPFSPAFSPGFCGAGEAPGRRREASEPPRHPHPRPVAVGSPRFPLDPFGPPEGGSADWSIPLGELRVEEKIGSGASSEVFAGTWRGSEVAIKRVVLPENEMASRAVQDFERELTIMLRLRHPNLVLLMGANLHTRPLFVVTELCAGGSLFDLLHARVFQRLARARPARQRHPRGAEDKNARRESARPQARGAAEAASGSSRLLAGSDCRARERIDGPRQGERRRQGAAGRASRKGPRDRSPSWSSDDGSSDNEDRPVLTWWQKAKIAFDVAKGCAYLHGSRPPIIHRDLKSLNILLTEKIVHRQQVPHAKVADFGLSRITTVAESTHAGEQHASADAYSRPLVANPAFLPAHASPHGHVAATSRTGIVGTYYWMAPEVIAAGTYSEKIDVYSYGIVLYELLSESLPYACPAEEEANGPEQAERRQRFTRSPAWGGCQDGRGGGTRGRDASPRRDSSSSASSCYASTPGDRSSRDSSEDNSSDARRSSRSLHTSSSEASDSPRRCSRRKTDKGKQPRAPFGQLELEPQQMKPRQRAAAAPLSPPEVCRKVVRGERPDLLRIPADCPPPLLELMQACWQQNAARRPSFEAITQILRSFLQKHGAVPRG
ncbi:putative Tyrosine kinase-like (TKL) protein [Neospora caninum Liverpool]|uniref:Putative Tyrosine kinase-like (TKL) protein n=1 Tax=Neospora caninum (strain Liverpool) TaxID=572307 RepID=F0VIZ2_NEOCL|nr:putative Tyrosine kinase-like (TKL) protein [Neospora caninum Liverpool]CBZ53703.1 putative Tyrosine kinase-like (TKL) protein [Neospora caninum Liverpool]|eukprot:XP_003883735.1 putative Tyrosine kinase-like (TKL) protein [Neospora caninum Liverpool]